jgi:DnaJ-class molecular chaperone
MPRKKRILGSEPPGSRNIINCPTCERNGELLVGWRPAKPLHGRTPVMKKCSKCGGAGRMQLVRVR